VKIFTCRTRRELHHSAIDLRWGELVFIQERESGLAFGPSMTFVQIENGLVDGSCVFSHTKIRVWDYQTDAKLWQRSIASHQFLMINLADR